MLKAKKDVEMSTKPGRRWKEVGGLVWSGLGFGLRRSAVASVISIIKYCTEYYTYSTPEYTVVHKAMCLRPSLPCLHNVCRASYIRILGSWDIHRLAEYCQVAVRVVGNVFLLLLNITSILAGRKPPTGLQLN